MLAYLGKVWLKRIITVAGVAFLKFSLPLGPMLMKTKKEIYKLKNPKKLCGDMVNSYLSTKCGVDSLDGL